MSESIKIKVGEPSEILTNKKGQKFITFTSENKKFYTRNISIRNHQGEIEGTFTTQEIGDKIYRWFVPSDEFKAETTIKTGSEVLVSQSSTPTHKYHPVDDKAKYPSFACSYSFQTVMPMVTAGIIKEVDKIQQLIDKYADFYYAKMFELTPEWLQEKSDKAIKKIKKEMKAEEVPPESNNNDF